MRLMATKTPRKVKSNQIKSSYQRHDWPTNIVIYVPSSASFVYRVLLKFLLRISLCCAEILHCNLLTNCRTMRELYQSSYKAVAVEEQQSTSSAEDSALNHYHSTFEHQTVFVEKLNKRQPRPLGGTCLQRVLRLVFDLIVGSMALLFAIFGIWVYRIDGNVASPETTGSKLLSVSQYVSYADPILTRFSW